MKKTYNNEESDKKYLRLKNFVSSFEEREKELIAKWKIYSNLSQSQMSDLKSKWARFYEDSRNTKIYELFRKQSEAFKLGDKQTVLDIAREMTRISEEGEFEYKKPSSIDPDEMRMRLQGYWQVKDLLEGTSKSEPNEAKEVFGKSESFEFAEKIF